jgi:hypothetical protein
VAIQVVASGWMLMYLASELGKAKKAGDPAKIAEAQRAHDAYRDLCLRADRLIWNVPDEPPRRRK